MYCESSTDRITLITELPPKTAVHEMAFDETGTKVALACSDKTVKIYRKYEDGWKQESFIKLVGAAGWKLKWARPQSGVILAVCSLDRIIALYQWSLSKKQGRERYEWSMIQSISNISVEDFKFSPINKLGLTFGIVDSTGIVQVKSLNDSSLNRGEYHASKLGLNCLSFYKKTLTDKLIMALGSKSHETTPLRALQGFKDLPNGQKNKIQEILTIQFVAVDFSQPLSINKLVSHGFQEKKAVNDISWAHNNGRSYNMLAVATDISLKIYEVNFKEVSEGSQPKAIRVEATKAIDLCENKFYRISWNMFGTYLAASQRKKVRMFKSICRGTWKQFKQVEDK